MNREEAIKIFQLMKKILSIPNSDAARTIEAIDMAIEALTDSINCVKCKHYYETEDDTDVHGHCRMDTAHTDLISVNKWEWLIPIISLVALTVAVVGLLAQIWRICQ